MKRKQSYSRARLGEQQQRYEYDLREGPDGYGDIEIRGVRTGLTVDELTDLLLLCPDHGAHTFKTQCGVTRCMYCGKVTG